VQQPERSPPLPSPHDPNVMVSSRTTPLRPLRLFLHYLDCDTRPSPLASWASLIVRRGYAQGDNQHGNTTDGVLGSALMLKTSPLRNAKGWVA
jgi:hypothetical protein